MLTFPIIFSSLLRGQALLPHPPATSTPTSSQRSQPPTMLSLAFEVYILFDSLLKCPCHFLCHMNVRPYFQCILTVHPSLQTLTSGRRRHGSSELQHASFPLQTFLGSSWGISGLFLLLSMRSVRVHVELSKHVFRKLREESNV